MSDIINFYNGIKPNADGAFIDEVMDYTDGQLEAEHGYIQFIFPSNEPSMMNCDAPTLTKEEAAIFQADPHLREMMKYSLLKILAFYGFCCIESSGPPVIEEAEGPANVERRRWLNHFNHNMLRITRILKSLRLCGLQEYAVAFYDRLRNYEVSANSKEYWRKATMEDLW